MIKVLFDQQIFLLQKHGGISRYFVELIKSFLNNPDFGVEPVLSFKKSFNRAAVEELTKFELDEIAGTAQQYIQIMSSYLHKIPIEKVDLVHHTYYLPGYYKKFNRIPSVTTLYDMIPEITKAKGKFGNPHLAKMKYLKESDLVFSISQSSTDDLNEILQENPIKAVTTYLGVGAEFSPKLSKLDWTTAPYFIYCGQREGYKDAETAISAFAEHVTSHSAKLYLVGGGPLTAQERELLSRLGIENLVEQVLLSAEELPRMYANAIALLFTSTYEGFGFPPLEALASGIPALVADTKIAREIYGSSVKYFPPRSAESLAHLMNFAAIGIFSGESQVKMGLEVAANFTWDNCARKTAEAYRDVLSRNSRP